MSCMPVTPAMLDLLEALTAWPDVDTEDLRRRPEWAQARAWGWVVIEGMDRDAAELVAALLR